MMKKSAFLLLFLSYSCLSCMAEGYRPLMADGKVWNQMLLKVTETDDFDTLYYSYSVMGDTTALGRPCKKVMKTADGKTELYKLVYEEDKKVFYKYENSWVQLYDFGLAVGDRIEGDVIVKIDTVSAGGGEFRRFYSSPAGSSSPGGLCWVEGIGAYTDLFTPENAVSWCEIPQMSSCYENGRCIFTQDDFYRPAGQASPHALYGTVRNQAGEPVSGAVVSILPYSGLSFAYKDKYDVVGSGVTDADGNYRIEVADEGQQYCNVMAEAPGHITYINLTNHATLGTAWDIVLRDALEFKSGQMSTLAMPVAPDASLGKFYEFEGLKSNGRMAFRRTLEPKAATPYLLIPSHDSIVSLRSLDLSVLADYSKQVGECTFNSLSYCVIGLARSFNSTVWRIDKTDDCGSVQFDGDTYDFIGGLRGIVSAPINRYWKYGEVELTDETSGVESLETAVSRKSQPMFDLQGRRVSGRPQRGVYIRDGRKVMVR